MPPVCFTEGPCATIAIQLNLNPSGELAFHEPGVTDTNA